MNQAIKLSFTKKLNLFITVLLIATIAPQLVNISPASADTGGYLWATAPCAWNGSTMGTCSNYDWGESTCPPGDSYCTSDNQINGYYLYDQWGEGFRNCTSYSAWKVNQMFNINPNNWKNGADWNNSALAAGYSDDQSPQIGDIAQWNATSSNQFGHVAYVYNVVSGVAYYAEYNYAGDGTFSNTYTSITQGSPDHWIHIGTIPTGVTALSSFVTSDGIRHVISARANALYETWYGTGSVNTTQLWAGDGSQINDVSAFVTSDGINHVITGQADGTVYETWYGTGSVTTTQLWAGTGSAVKSVTAFVTSDGIRHAISGLASGAVYETWYGNGSGTSQLRSGAGASVNAVSGFVTPDGIRHVVTAEGQALYETWYGNGSGTSQLWAGNGTTAKDVAAFGTSDGIRHADSGANNGATYDTWYGNGSGTSQLWAGASTQVNSVSAFVTSDNIRHLIIGEGQALYESWYGNGSGTSQLWSGDGSTLNAVTSFVTSDGIRHAISGTQSGHIYETWYGTGTVTTTQLY